MYLMILIYVSPLLRVQEKLQHIVICIESDNHTSYTGRAIRHEYNNTQLLLAGSIIVGRLCGTPAAG